MKGNVFKLPLTTFTYIQSSIDSKNNDRKFCNHVFQLMIDLINNGNFIEFNISKISTLAKFQQCLYIQSFLLQIPALMKVYEHNIKLHYCFKYQRTLKSNFEKVGTKHQQHSTFIAEKIVIVFFFFHLKRYVNMSQLDQSDLINMSYIEKILCFGHDVYSYISLRKTEC